MSWVASPASPQRNESTVKMTKPAVYRAGSPDHVGGPPGVEHENGRHERVADDDPEQGAEVCMQFPEDVGQGMIRVPDVSEANRAPMVVTAEPPSGRRGARGRRGGESGSTVRPRLSRGSQLLVGSRQEVV